jgi:hypothetical protein
MIISSQKVSHLIAVYPKGSVLAQGEQLPPFQAPAWQANKAGQSAKAFAFNKVRKLTA